MSSFLNSIFFFPFISLACPYGVCICVCAHVSGLICALMIPRCLCRVALLRHVVSIAAARADTANPAHFLLSLHWRWLALTLFPPSSSLCLLIYLLLLLLESKRSSEDSTLGSPVFAPSDVKGTWRGEQTLCTHRNRRMLNINTTLTVSCLLLISVIVPAA